MLWFIDNFAARHNVICGRLLQRDFYNDCKYQTYNHINVSNNRQCAYDRSDGRHG
jgi:hypothetical protein